MARYWWEVFWEGFWNSIEAIGQPLQVLLFSALVVLLGGFFIWQKHGWQAMKENLVKTIAEVFLVGLIAWLPFLFAYILRASYLRWNNANQSTQAAEAKNQEFQKKFDQLTMPRFEVAHGQIAISSANVVYPKVTEQRTIIILPVTVFNHGAPSVIRDMRMTVHFKEGEELRGIPYSPKQPEVSLPGERGAIAFPTSSSLFIRGRNTIPTGGQADGFVMFEFPGGLQGKIDTEADWVKLEIMDVNTILYPILLTRTGSHSKDFFMSPGMLTDH